jgi:hypothetical protein
MISIQTSAGRPRGSTKPEEAKAKEAADFEAIVEQTVSELFAKTGIIPTKTEVAQTISSGINPKTGTDSRLSVFSVKLKRMKIDFEEIVKRVQG